MYNDTPQRTWLEDARIEDIMELPELSLDVINNCDYSATCLKAVADAYRILQQLPEDATPEEKLSARNRILANEGVLADMFGTISTMPTLTKEIMGMRGLKPAEAEMVEQHRDIIRDKALSLTRVE